MTQMEIFIGVIFTLFMGVFAFYSCVILEEQKTGKRIILPWEKK
jgi:hypothetical protein